MTSTTLLKRIGVVLLVLPLGLGGIGVHTASGQTYDRVVQPNDATASCQFTATDASVSDALNNAQQGEQIYICEGDYTEGGTLEITVASLTIVGAGRESATITSTSNGPAISIQANGARLESFGVIHDRSGINGQAPAVGMDAVSDVRLEDLRVERQNGRNTAPTIRPSGTDITVTDCDLLGGPIGFPGSEGSDYTITDNTITGAGDEGIWVVDANTLTITGNTIAEGSGSASPNQPGRLGIAAYNVTGTLTLANNDLEASDVAFVIGSGLTVEVAGTTFDPLSTADGMRSVIGATELNGNTPGKVAFLAQENGTLVSEADPKGPNGEVHVVRTGITNVPGDGGAAPYTQSTLDAAAQNNVIHLASGFAYPESFSVGKDLNFSVPSEATVQNIEVVDDVNLGVPTGEVQISSGLTLGQGSILTGTPIEILGGATVTDNGLTEGQLTATRTMSAGQTEPFGAIGLTIETASGSTAPGAVTVTRTDGTRISGPTGDASIARYFDVTADVSSGLSYSVDLEYDDAEIGTQNAEPDLYLYRAPDGSADWTGIEPDRFDQNANVIGVDGQTSFSRFTAANAGSTLPVELASFTGRADGQAAVLTWRTATETSNAGFRVQQKTETGFETLTFIEGAGTTSEATRYTHRVDELAYGTHTFRLEQVDRDGTTSLTDEIAVEIQLDGPYEVSEVAPNPVRGTGTVEVVVKESQRVTVALYDALGRQVQTLRTGRLPGGERQRIRLQSQTLSSGPYFLRVRGETFQTTRRVTVVR